MSIKDNHVETLYEVVANKEAQYSIWPADKAIPSGWEKVGKQGFKEPCLAYIKDAWTEMRTGSCPVTLSHGMARPEVLQEQANTYAEQNQKQQLVVASSFTAEPIEEALMFWMTKLGMPSRIQFAPYNQVFQSLLDPQSQFAVNQGGINLILLRLEDWIRYAGDDATAEEHFRLLHGNAEDLIAAVGSAVRQTNIPLFVCFCPPSRAFQARREYCLYCDALQSRLILELRAIVGVYPVASQELNRLYPVADDEDDYANDVGHIPYTQEMYAAIATLLARNILALRTRPYKVIVLDCDNTLWQGICGEVGPHGIRVTPAYQALQTFMLAQHDAGMLLCLCSKNSVEDVAQVFEECHDMRLQQKHIIASRINWLPKSENIKSLAKELQLGLDSFIFIDDNPVECAEVQANCQGVLVLQLPEQSEHIPVFLEHVWAFDRLVVTVDAQQRTLQYRQNQQREATRTNASSFEAFLTSLELQVDVMPLQMHQLERTAELTQRTNQFNLRPAPRHAADIQTLCETHQCLVVDVHDRFGAYGLTGVVVYRAQEDILKVDTFLLSCRILGRGVEHQVLAQLGRIARQAGCHTLELPYLVTGKNQPILHFLETVADKCPDDDIAPQRFTISTPRAVHVTVSQSAAGEMSTAKPRSQATASATALSRLALINDIAHELQGLPEIMQSIASSKPRAAVSRNGYAAPRTPAEQMLADIWAKVLVLDKVGVHDNFFDLGGHSLLATRVISQIRAACQTDLSLHALFESPTIAMLAPKLDLASQEHAGLIPPAIVPVARNGTLPLSFAQQRLWFLDQLESGSAFYNIPAALRLVGHLDVAALRCAFNQVVRRHDVLRTTFVTVDGTPMQVIAPLLELFLPVTDLTGLPHVERDAKVQWLMQDEAQMPFDLSTGPLIRAGLIRLRTTEYILVFTMHHIVYDGWSIGVLMQEVAALYAAYVHDLPSPLPALPIQYADFAHWQRQRLTGDVLVQQLNYWTGQLAGAPTLLALPTDRPRPSVQRYRGAVLRFTVPVETTTGLYALGKQAQTTLFMTLTAAFNVLLSRYSGQTDICIGTPIANRNRAEIESLIGFFVNTLVLRTLVDANASFDALLQQVRANALGAYAHQDVPFEQLVDALKPERHVSHAPLFQVMLALQNAPMGNLALPGLTLEPVATESATARFDLTLNITEDKGQLLGAFEYNTDLFDAATIERMAGHFTCLLAAVGMNPASRIGDLPMLSPGERTQLLVDWNDTATNDPQAQMQTIHQLFEAQAQQTPHHVAVVFEGAELTYGELNANANRLAHHLRGLGVGADTLVGICVEPSLEMIVGLLGILKAGGAYVPLDPAYPKERLAYMLADATPALLLTQRHLHERLPASGISDIATLYLDAQWNLLADNPTDNPGNHTRPDDLAYVIYTSGSTGQPKGVLLTHHGLCNLVHAQITAFAIQPAKRILQFASFNFDASTSEIFMALSSGATLCLAPRHRLMPGLGLEETLQQLAITAVTLPPVALHALSAEVLAGLETIIVAGEACPKSLVEQWAGSHRFFNAYGPTEATVCASIHRCHPDRAGNPPIGRPIANTWIYLLDTHLNPVPVGVAGELHIAGAGLARGYLNRPDLTADKFIPNPFGSPGARMYKSGDLARYLPDGNIEYLGRIDDQVKIRGFRIELGEIQAALTILPDVRDVMVLAREDNPGDKRLVAYLVPCEGSVQASVAGLRAALLNFLPDYMVPAHFIFLDRFPLTPNGKIDRKALPAPAMTHSDIGYVAPRTSTEKILAVIWAKILKLDKVGVADNFFALGGHSLLSIELFHSMKRQLNITFPLATIFTAPTVAALAAIIDAGRHSQSLLAPLQQGGDGQPVFCVHPVGGQIFFYLELARHLGSEFPVYGIQSAEVAGWPHQFDTMEAMASAYCATIKAKQANGPYRLIGWSTGGLIAMAIAADLEKQGCEVEYIGLLDSKPIRNDIEVTEEQTLFRAMLATLSAIRGAPITPDESKEMQNLLDENKLSITDLFSAEHQVFARAYLGTWARTVISADILEHLKLQLKITQHHLMLLAGFLPGKVKAPLHVCRTRESFLPASGFSFYDESDPTQNGGSRTNVVGGDHYSMLKEPHIRQLAETIAAFLQNKQWQKPDQMEAILENDGVADVF